MPSIDVDEQTAQTINFAAQTAGITPGDVIRGLVLRTLTTAAANPDDAPSEPEEVPIHALYEGYGTSATYNRTTKRVTITDGPLAGKAFKSPSGAAIAVITHYRPSVNPNRNGWSFWTVTSTGELLQSIRPADQTSSRRQPHRSVR